MESSANNSQVSKLGFTPKTYGLWDNYNMESYIT